MKITTQYVSDYEYKATTSEGHAVDIDMRKEDKVRQSPMEMVLSALAGCVAVEVALMVKKRRKILSDLIIEASANRKEAAPRSFTDIHLKFILISPDAKLEELQKISKLTLEKYCSVADSLKADVTFDCEVRQ